MRRLDLPAGLAPRRERRLRRALRPARLDRPGACRYFLCLAVALALACNGVPGAGSIRPSGPLGSIRDAPAAPADRPDHVLLVSIAGMTPDLYLNVGTPMPILAELARAGVAAEVVESVAPPAAYPVHTSLVTGRPPNDHGVPADQMLGDRGVRRSRYWHASYVRGATLWQSAVGAGIGAAALDWPVTLGAAIPLLLPDVLPTRRGERWIDLLADTATPWLLELARAMPADFAAAATPGPGRDALLVDLACDVVASQSPPGLILLRLTQTDPILTVYGPYSEQALQGFAQVDAELGDLIECLEDADLLLNTAMVVVGDRAMLPVHTAIRPNSALEEAGLLQLDTSGAVESWSALVRSNGGSAFVYARDERAAVEARRALEIEAARSGAYWIISADEMIRRAADSEAWFGLEARSGFAFEDAPGGPLLQPSMRRAVGGYLERHSRAGPGLVAWGRGVRRNLRIPEIDQLDIAPTLARLLAVELPGARRRAFVGMLHLPEPPRAAERRGTENGGDPQ